MKKKLLLLSMIVCILAVATVGGTLAYATTTSGTITGQYETPGLAVSLAAASDTQNDEALKLTPGGAAQSISYTATNTDATPEFVCVTITKYWAKDQEKDMAGVTNPADILLDGLDNLNAGDTYGGEWIVLRKSTEQIVLVHAGHLNANEQATVSGEVRLSAAAGLANAGYQPQIHVSAQAVQYLDGNDTVNANAILAAWGVQANIANGTITGVTL